MDKEGALNKYEVLDKEEAFFEDDDKLLKEDTLLGKSKDQVASTHYKLYKYRFLMLFLLSLGLFLNGNFWISFCAVTPQLVEYFNKTEIYINWFANLFHIIPAILSFPAIYLQRFLGLRKCLIFAALFHSLGCVLKLVGIVVPNLDPNARYMLCFVGFCFYAVAQAAILNLPAILSAQWFGIKERELSTSAPWIANLIGVCFGFVFPYSTMTSASILKNPQLGVIIIVSVEFAIANFGTILTIIFAKDRPLTPPSRSEEKNIEATLNESFTAMSSKIKDSMIACCKSWKVIHLFVLFSIVFTATGTISTFLSEMVEFYISSELQLAGYMGATALSIGAISTFFFGFLASKLGPKSTIPIAIFTNLFTVIPLAIIMALNITRINTNTIMFILYALYGSTNNVFTPLACEIIANCSYPIDQSVTTNIYILFGNILATIVVAIIPLFPKNIKYSAALIFGIFTYLFSAVSLLVIKFENKRLQMDTSMDAL